ncbi:sugar kinase [Teredinibacter franksiae]|uniref:sugar kinase n=1 Tax=Teredinibacter franksiae TaxID=2761453 RepID=UPI001624A295|nr:sugar kinase [Teredinibacter franksiae]
MARIAAIGEVMVELAPHPSTDASDKDIMALGFAGDTFNTAIYMARTGIQTEYVTLLGDDPYSEKIFDLAKAENVGTSMMETMAGRLPGMYVIRNSPDGEREFYYWRKEARARELFAAKAHTENLINQLKECDYVYLSGITLAIISDHSRLVLLRFIKEYRAQGGTFCFDINYRPRLWDNDQTMAQYVMAEFMEHTDIALLTLDDEAMLWGDGSIDATIERYKNNGIKELVLKRGAEEVVAYVNGEKLRVPVSKVDGVVDTTGAGDSFNAGYLSARAQGFSYEDAARHGIHVASIVIRNRGAIVKKASFNGMYNGLN